MRTRHPALAGLMGVLFALAGCGGAAAPASSQAPVSSPPAAPSSAAPKPAASTAASPKPSAAAQQTAAAKPSAAASAAAPASAKPAASGNLQPITYGVAGVSAFSWPHFAAVQQDYFGKQGLQVNESATQTPAVAAKALVGGSLDIAEGSIDSFATAIEEGAAITMIAQKIGNPAFSVITQPEIKSWDQLKGAKVAVSGPNEAAAIVFNQLASKHGLTAQKDYSFVPVGITPARYAAMKAKQVQAAIMNQPVDFQAVADGYNQLERSDLSTDHYAFIVVVTSKAWAQAHRDVVVRYLKAEVQGVDWLYDPANKQAAIDLLVSKTKVAPDAAQKTYDIYVGTQGKVVSKGAKFDLEGMRVYAGAMKEVGVLKNEVDPQKWIDTSYLDAVK